MIILVYDVQFSFMQNKFPTRRQEHKEKYFVASVALWEYRDIV